MEIINDNEISAKDYFKIRSKIDSMINEVQLILVHKQLIGKTCRDDEIGLYIKDCGFDFIKKFLSRDWGRTIIYKYAEGANQFIYSKYLSDYFKNTIIEFLSDEDIDYEISDVLNSVKRINDMNEEEINMIYSSVTNLEFKQQQSSYWSLSNCFMSYLYKLNGKGIISFIKNNIDGYDLAVYILNTSGINDSAYYYSGRGVNYGDLNDENLVAIFNKLIKIDVNYAINFVNMVCKMKTLGATEFINTFKKFATNNFTIQHLDISDNNNSLDGVYGEQRNTIAYFSILSSMNMMDNNYQIKVSQQMKNDFISKIEPILQSFNLQYDQNFEHCSRRK